MKYKCENVFKGIGIINVIFIKILVLKIKIHKSLIVQMNINKHEIENKV